VVAICLIEDSYVSMNRDSLGSEIWSEFVRVVKRVYHFTELNPNQSWQQNWEMLRQTSIQQRWMFIIFKLTSFDKFCTKVGLSACSGIFSRYGILLFGWMLHRDSKYSVARCSESNYSPVAPFDHISKWRVFCKYSNLGSFKATVSMLAFIKSNNIVVPDLPQPVTSIIFCTWIGLFY
jgi:hypothetical protein